MLVLSCDLFGDHVIESGKHVSCIEPGKKGEENITKLKETFKTRRVPEDGARKGGEIGRGAREEGGGRGGKRTRQQEAEQSFPRRGRKEGPE